jgi:DNA-binding transcriptional ArsR family regulator
MEQSALQDEYKPCIRVYPNQVQIQHCIETIQRVEPSIVQLAQVMVMMASEIRLKLLYLLNGEEGLCVCHLGDLLSMAIPAVSQHLRKLKDARLIQPRRVGQTVYYSLPKEALTVLGPVLAQIGPSNTEITRAEPLSSLQL